MSLRTTLILVFLAIIVGGLVYFNPFQRPGERAPEPPWFYNVSMDDISRIDIEHQGQKASFIRKAPGKWYFEEPENIPVNRDRWGGITLLLSGPQTRRELAAEVIENPEQYGLVNPTTVIDVTLEGDRTIQVRLGGKTPDGVAHYAQMGGYPQLFLIDSSWGQVLSRLVTEPPYPPWYFRKDIDKIVGLKVAHGGVEVAFRRDKDGQWVFDDGNNSPIDKERWASVLPLLGGPTSIEMVEEEVRDASVYGVTQDSTHITLKYKTQTEGGIEYNDTIIYVLGDKTPDGSAYYAQAMGFKPVIALDTLWSETLIGLATDPPYAKSPQVSLPGS